MGFGEKVAVGLAREVGRREKVEESEEGMVA